MLISGRAARGSVSPRKATCQVPPSGLFWLVQGRQRAHSLMGKAPVSAKRPGPPASLGPRGVNSQQDALSQFRSVGKGSGNLRPDSASLSEQHGAPPVGSTRAHHEHYPSRKARDKRLRHLQPPDHSGGDGIGRAASQAIERWGTASPARFKAATCDRRAAGPGRLIGSSGS
jgi:hypothetical protein